MGDNTLVQDKVSLAKTTSFCSLYKAKNTIGFMVRNRMSSNLYLEGFKLLIANFFFKYSTVFSNKLS